MSTDCTVTSSQRSRAGSRFVEDLDEVQQKALQEIGPAAVHLIGWAWLHRAVLGQRSQLSIDDFPPEWHANVRELLSAWDQAERREQLRGELAQCPSSFSELLYRSLPAGMLALLAVWHNHRVAPRGNHEGLSPVQRGGLATQATDWLEALGYPSAIPVVRHPASVKPNQQARAA